jgi:predicted nucleic acid-binding protein
MIYLDTSVLFPLFVRETTTPSVRRWLASVPFGESAISEWTRTEFMSGLGIRVRSGSTDAQLAREIVRMFNEWAEDSLEVLVPEREDFLLSSRYLERFELGLRAGDALHLAIASNHGARMLYSLDQALIKGGHALNIKCQIPV